MTSQAGLIGVLIGAGITSGTQWIIRSGQRRSERRTASMIVATLLRTWLSDCVTMICEVRSWQTSEGNDGNAHIALPELPLQLEHIARLPDQDAQDLVELMHYKRGTDLSMRGLMDVTEIETAAEEACLRMGSAFEDALRIYGRLAGDVGWNTAPLPPDQVALVREEVARFKERARLATLHGAAMVPASE